MKPELSLRRLIRCHESDITCTGGVVFIGDGHTGKTHGALNLASYREGAFMDATCRTIQKSINLEFEYFIAHSNIEKFKVTISSQLFIMPGQKGRAESGEGLAYEDAIDLYFDIRSINEIIVLVLTYSLADIRTFQNLEYWLNKAIQQELIQEYTSIILLGTHLDLEDEIVVTEEMIEQGISFVQGQVEDKIGVHIANERIFPVKISNMTKEGIREFQRSISQSFYESFEIQELISDQLDESKKGNINE